MMLAWTTFKGRRRIKAKLCYIVGVGTFWRRKMREQGGFVTCSLPVCVYQSFLLLLPSQYCPLPSVAEFQPMVREGKSFQRHWTHMKFLKIRWLIKNILLPCGNINMQIQPILDIRESPWELSPEAQTHNKLLLTATVCFLFLPVDLQFGAFAGCEGRREREK